MVIPSVGGSATTHRPTGAFYPPPHRDPSPPMGAILATNGPCGIAETRIVRLSGGGTPAETRRIISWIFAAHQMGGALAGNWRRRGAQLQRRLPPCVYDERPRLPVGLAVGAADQGPRACHSARGLTGRERDLRFRGPGTEGSNPAPSSGESIANLTFRNESRRCPSGFRCSMSP
jgi:hypothetical protein